MNKYILIGRLPVPCDDLMEWAEWFEKADRHVAQSEVGCLRVSTVFLGIDHSFRGARPILFETMIFGDGYNNYQTRCSTWEAAEAMHAEAIRQAEKWVDTAKLVTEDALRAPGIVVVKPFSVPPPKHES